eukprot:403344496
MESNYYRNPQSQANRDFSTPNPPTSMPEKKCFVKVVAIGDSGVGKTSLIQMFEHSRFTEAFKPTIGADFSNKEVSINGKIVTLQIWDTAGQERYQSLGTAFYRGADCCLIAYDLSNSSSFENITQWKQSFMQKGMIVNPETFPFMIVGNKLDIAEDSRQVSEQAAKRYCQENGNMPHVETSARNNVNVEQAFVQLAEIALKRQEEMQKRTDEQLSQDRARERGAQRLGHNQNNRRSVSDRNLCFRC